MKKVFKTLIYFKERKEKFNFKNRKKKISFQILCLFYKIFECIQRIFDSIHLKMFVIVLQTGIRRATLL